MKTRIRGGKRKKQISHALTRANERYETSFNKKDMEDIAKIIKLQKGKDVGLFFIEKFSLRVSKWVLKYKNCWIVALYDKERKSISTILPPDSVKKSVWRMIRPDFC